MIHSTDNPKIKHVIALKKENRRKKSGLIVIEGKKEVTMARQAGLKIKELYCLADSGQTETPNLVLADQVYKVSDKVFRAMSFRQNIDGYLAVAKEPAQTLDRLKPGPTPLFLVLNNLEKPGNLGAAARIADATGADALLVCDPQVDIYNHNVIRASRGSVFIVPVIKTTSQKALAWLAQQGVQIVVTSPQADQDYDQLDLKGSTAIVIGSENRGVDSIWLENDLTLAKIPLLGQIDSLNASVSAGVLLYEALRQRRSGSHPE